MKWVAPLVGALAMVCATSSVVVARESSNIPEAHRANSMERSPGMESSDLREAARILRTHNAERQRLQLEPLKWNLHLAREARQWARVLSDRGSLQHADRQTRNGTGENLWMGTTGQWPVEVMVGTFLDERKNYRHASFPHISRTGKWADVGHYSQIVWRDTKEVGCALVTARGNDVLVCRYWPAGNVWGQKAY